MSCSHYLVSAAFGLDYRDMRMVHAFIDTGAGSNLYCSEALPIGWNQNLVTLAHLPGLEDSNSRPLQLFGVVLLLLRLANHHLRVPLLVTKHLADPMIIGTELLEPHVWAIWSIAGVEEITAALHASSDITSQRLKPRR